MIKKFSVKIGTGMTRHLCEEGVTMKEDILLLAINAMTHVIADKSERLNMCERDCLLKALTIVMHMKNREDQTLARGEEKGC
jgi:hypothetical protein